MNRIKTWLKKFFFPPSGSPLWLRLLPYAVLGILTLVVFVSSAYAWEYTNSPEFCGEACHTMPPEYTAYLTSPHARIDCVDCHIGDGFITTRVTRKAGDAKHIISLAFKDYEYPITAHEMRPARQTCELCHFPEKFSDDSLREIKHYGDDIYNTPTTTYLVLKTGGGAKRLGLGRGIHWHIENQVFFQAVDERQQVIPYVRVIEEDGSISEYFDIESSFTATDVVESELVEMDCITCHNRITHLVNPPEVIVDELLDRGVISDQIPYIRWQGVDLFYREYESKTAALATLALLDSFYAVNYPEFYAENQPLIQEAIAALQTAYDQSVFPEQKSDWDSHPDNVGHTYSPGCLRCHDGKHLTKEQEAIRLECNLCHSIPVVAGIQDFVADIEISRGPEPVSHLNTNWITLHRDIFDPTCSNCHTTEDPGGTSNTSFCSNSACHGSVFTFAGFDAPALREMLLAQIPPSPEPTPLPTEAAQTPEETQPQMPEEPPQTGEEDLIVIEGPVTYNEHIAPLLALRCTSCHGENGLQELNLTTYEGVMTGGLNGPTVQPGDPASSLLIQKVSGAQSHFATFTPDELALVEAWIAEGAPSGAPEE
ncbi:MAG: NapC/NirT family cytochrome c [Anaerolineales bacterium]|nr:NapC/NirT family cytochrome c [Anaerolineales bacterium]